MQCLHCLEGGLDSYSQMTETATINDVKDLSIIGMDLNALIEYTNKMLGSLIIVDYGTSMFGIVIGIYFSLTMTNVVQEVYMSMHEYVTLMQQASYLYYFAGKMAVGNFILQPCLYCYIWYFPLTLGQLSQCCTKDDQSLWQYQNQPPKYVALRFALKIISKGDNREVFKILSDKTDGHI